MIEAFFAGDYDFLGQRHSSQLPDFCTRGEEWQLIEEDGRVLCLQDRAKWVLTLSAFEEVAVEANGTVRKLFM